MKVSVRFEGGREIQRVLHDIAHKVKRDVTVQALMAGAVPVVEAARRFCPRGHDYDKDNAVLAENIRAVPVRDTKRQAAAEDTSVGIGAPSRYFYDHFLEYGTEKMGARPFYRPALDSTHSYALNRIGAHYWTAIAEAGI